jgi:predicted AlkP superfamily pyrophosphatase or phosphodiesterase
MTKTVLHIVICVLTLTACNSENSAYDNQNWIEIGEYSFKFPNDFELIKEKGIDSYVGKISNGKIDFQFDYGYYSDPLDKSVDEFLSRDVWKLTALGRNNLLPEGDITGLVEKTELIRYYSSDSINYTLIFQYESDTIQCTVKIPEEIQKLKVDIDTIDNIRYKFVRSYYYVGMNVKNLMSFNKSMNSCKSLSILATKLSPDEIKKCYEILRTCKPTEK